MTPRKPRVIVSPPEYPHTSFIAQLSQDSLERVLSEEEAMAITEATMLENLIEDTIPELRKSIERFRCAPGCCEHCKGEDCLCSKHPALEVANAKLFLGVAVNFAQGMSADVRRVMERRKLLHHISGLKPQ
jgi:hypothetical protein